MSKVQLSLERNTTIIYQAATTTTAWPDGKFRNMSDDIIDPYNIVTSVLGDGWHVRLSTSSVTMRGISPVTSLSVPSVSVVTSPSVMSGIVACKYVWLSTTRWTLFDKLWHVLFVGRLNAQPIFGLFAARRFVIRFFSWSLEVVNWTMWTHDDKQSNHNCYDYCTN